MTENIDHTPDVSLRAVRVLSKALFSGAQYRIEIGAAISEIEVVNTAELAARLKIARQSVNQELQVLERIGLLVRGPNDSGRKVYLMRQESSYWRWCAEILPEAATMLERKPRF